MSHDLPEQAFRVVLNDEEQYSIWMLDRDLPLGWREAGFSGEKQACLTWIAETWSDMRPLSLRKAMDRHA